MAGKQLQRPMSPALPTRTQLATGADSAVAEAVEVYHRTYTTVLRSSGETKLRVLEASHIAMASSLHPLAASPELDMGAFLYALRRLPQVVVSTELVVMGQSLEVFVRHQHQLESWSEVGAPGRRVTGRTAALR